MSIMVKIDGVPLFNSKWKAERWGKRFGLTGTHTHIYRENTMGWMAGESHTEVSKVFKYRERVYKTIYTTQTTQTATQTLGQPSQPTSGFYSEGQGDRRGGDETGGGY